MATDPNNYGRALALGASSGPGSTLVSSSGLLHCCCPFVTSRVWWASLFNRWPASGSTRRPAAERGTVSAPAKSSSATNPASVTAAGTPHGSAAHATKPCKGRAPTSTAVVLSRHRREAIAQLNFRAPIHDRLREARVNGSLRGGLSVCTHWVPASVHLRHSAPRRFQHISIDHGSTAHRLRRARYGLADHDLLHDYRGGSQ